MNARVLSIVLADDHALVRRGFLRILASQADLRVVGEAADGREALLLLREARPDLAVLDVSMPNLGGIETARQIAHEFPRLRILALSMHKDAAYVREMLRAGAHGYLLKDCSEEEFLGAVRAVGHGKAWLSPAVGDAVLHDYRKHVVDPLDLLTPREREVLRAIAEGRTNKEIASALGISVYTVEAHRGRLMEKLNLHSVSELVRFAVRHGLVE